MYYGAVRERVLSYIRRHGLMRAGDRVGVAVSGGADSVALLRLLLELRAELGVVLAVVHFNHQIRGEEADNDERFVSELAAAHGLDFYRDSFNTSLYARQHGMGLESGGRDLRYMFFLNLLAGKLNTVATAHTMDDQAETVLLRIMRGAGTRGMAGIFPRLAFSCSSSEPKEFIVRPLLGVRRAELREYLAALGQIWREDASNLDVKFTRNRVRHELLPMIEREFNPSIVPVLAEMAEVARGEEEFWEAEVSRLLEQQIPRGLKPTRNDKPQGAALPGARSPEPAARLDRALLHQQPLAVQRRLLRELGDQVGLALEFAHVKEILELSASIQSLENKQVELPDGWLLTLSARELRLQRGGLLQAEGKGYQYPLPIPGELHIPELDLLLKAALVPAVEAGSGYNRTHSLDPRRLASGLVVRNWRPGDRFWPAHSKSPRKLKELLLRRRIPQPKRALWPVVVSGETVVWVPGWGAAADLLPDAQAGTVVVIEEVTVARPSD